MESRKIRVILKQIFGEKINEEYELTGSEVTIGRSPKCDITLSSPSVSRKHCILTYINGIWNIFDNKSQNGTYINGRRLGPAEKYDLQYGDIVFLGPPSEMPQAFSYEEHHEDMETDDDDDDIIELPPIKRRCEENIKTPVKKLIRSSDIENNVDYGSVASGSESRSQDLSRDDIKTKLKNLDIHNNVTPIKKVCIKKEPTVSNSKYSTNENSSAGSDNYDSESLLDEGIASYIDPTISYYPEEHWESNKRKSRNSLKSKELEVKLALLSEEIKALQESKLELLKKYEDVCEKNKVLDKQLIEKQKELEDNQKQNEIKVKNEVKSDLLKKFEEELVCNICTELFIKPVVLDCSHTFCEYCIKEWKKKKNDCPICRCKIKNSIRVRTLEEFIDKVLTTLTPEQRLIREHAKAQRILAEQPQPRQPVRTPRRRGRGSSRRTHSRYSRTNVVNANISLEIVEEILSPSHTGNLRSINRSNGSSSNPVVLNDEEFGHGLRRHTRTNPNSDTGNQRPVGDLFPYLNEYDVEFRLPALSTMGFFY